jgi:hypothetical protein
LPVDDGDMSFPFRGTSRGFLVTLVFLSAAAPAAAGWEPIRPPGTRPDSLRVVGGAIFHRRPLPWPPTILSDSQRVASLAAALASETRTQVFGDKWIESNGHTGCLEYSGAIHSHLSEDYWMYGCGGTDALGRVEWFYYDFQPEHPPSLERRLRTVIGAPDSDRRAWLHAFRATVAELSTIWDVTAESFQGDSLLAVIPAHDRRIHVQLDELSDHQAPRIRIDQFSDPLWARMSGLGWYADETWLHREMVRDDSLRAARRRSDAAALRPREPALARALSRDVPAPGDTSIVFDALRRAARPSVKEAERDLILYGVDRWVWWMFWSSTDSVLAARVDAALHPFQAGIVGQGSVWHYEHGLLKHLEMRPWSSEWRGQVFLDWMENLCEFAGDGTEWKHILERGNEYLGKSPSSAHAPEVILHLAEAHETAWSVGLTMGSSMPEYAGYRDQSADHREKAIALYERYLRVRPESSEAGEIRRRLRRLRINMDTGFWKYYCPSEC